MQSKSKSNYTLSFQGLHFFDHYLLLLLHNHHFSLFSLQIHYFRLRSVFFKGSFSHEPAFYSKNPFFHRYIATLPHRSPTQLRKFLLHCIHTFYIFVVSISILFYLTIKETLAWKGLVLKTVSKILFLFQ